MNSRHPQLLADIDAFLAETGMGETYFGRAAAGNSELVRRLRDGGRIWPDTEVEVRAFMAFRRTLAAREGRT